MECKHGNEGHCALCDEEDQEHDRAMVALWFYNKQRAADELTRPDNTYKTQSKTNIGGLEVTAAKTPAAPRREGIPG